MDRRDFLKIVLPLCLGAKASAAKAEQPELMFGVIADPQYADADTNSTRFFRNSLGKLNAAISKFNEHPLDFTVTVGDFIDRDFASYRPVLDLYAKLKSRHFAVLGNHDFSVELEEKTKVMGVLGMEKAYYSKVIKGWRFVFLDGTAGAVWRYGNDADRRTAAATLLEMGTRLGRNVDISHTAIGPQQLAWLETELAAADKAGQKVIVFNHYPAWPAAPAHLLDAADLVTIIGRHKHVAAYINGHNHFGNYALRDGCHYVNFKGMVETEKETAYGIVRCFSDRLEIAGYGLEPKRRLA